MKKKIIFVMLSLNLGGIEKSLINLLNLIDYNKYEVELLLFAKNGDLVKRVPDTVIIREGNFLLSIISRSFKETWHSKKVISMLLRLLCMVLIRVLGYSLFYKVLLLTQKNLKGYDVAISYCHDSGGRNFYNGCNQFVLSKISSQQKVSWIHTDIIRANMNIKKSKEIYEMFDKIVNVSKAGKNEFDQLYPEYREKSYVVYNMFPIEEIKEASEIESSFSKDTQDIINIVTVARIQFSSKALERIVEVSKKLKIEELKFKWIIIGDGSDEVELRRLVVDNSLQNHIILLGKKENPYPYIKIADIFVLTSKYEGYPMVVGESIIIGTPVVTTYYEAAYEQIEQGINGLVVGNSSLEIYLIINELINNDDYLRKLQKSTKLYLFSNELAIQQFEKVV